MPEIEAKLSVHGPLEIPDLSQVDGITQVEERPAQQLSATYYDTEDLRLARNGITLRYRSGEDGGAGWTLKLPLDRDDYARNELSFEGGPGSVPRAASELVTAYVRSGALRAVIRIHTRRRRWDLMMNGAVAAQLSDDEVSVLADGRVSVRWRELEVEHRSGAQELIHEVAARLQRAGATEADQIPKAVRALGARATAPPDVVRPGRIDPDEPAGRAVAGSLAAGTHRLVTNDALVRLGDEEGIHQMRVAARRLRSDLRTFAPLIDQAWASELSAELKWIADALGEVRDLDVMQARLRKAGGGMEEQLAPLYESMDVRHEVAREHLVGALRSERFVVLLDSLVAAVTAPRLTERAERPCGESLPPLVEVSWRKLARRARSLRPGDPDDDFHRVRILAKRARYAAEAVAFSLGTRAGRQASRFASRCADVQDQLGQLQDAVVSAGMVRHLSEQHPTNGPFNLALGRLLERQELNARESKQAFFKVWNRLDRPKNVRWLQA